jgi:outer membrane protein assembly factor BamB
MHLVSPLAQRRRALARISAPHWFALSIVFVIGSLCADNASGQVFQPGQRQVRVFGLGQEPAAGVYLPTDRALSRAIARARERLADREYHEVLTFLQGILARDEDAFLERAGGDQEQQLGLKAAARQLIGELPPEGHNAYELLHGATARRQLEAAMRSGDREVLAKVVRQYFHTSAGYEAALVLAEMEADLGHRLAAAELYRELMDSPRAAARFEPQLSVAAALNLLAAGKREEAAEIVRTVASSHATAQVTLSGKSAPLPASSADPIAWLNGIVGEPQLAARSEMNWLTLRGDASRNSQHPGGPPHLRPRWEARVINEPSIESYLSSRSDDFTQRGVVTMPCARPIAVADVVVMRTPENIVAVDWQSGKRIWESRDEEELQSDLGLADAVPGIDRDEWNAQGKPLEERIWDDALLASLSSDGKRVFVIRGMSLAREEDAMAGFQPQFFARNGVEPTANTNQLAAYDIATQGKLVWELDGTRNAGKLAGAFFLGAPLAIDNTLYVMAEIRSALYLVALDPATGQVQWQQQLIGLETGIALDPARRKSAATPSYAGGVLICPTAASTVVGIDLVKREFAWVYRYPREARSAVDVRSWQIQQMQPSLVRANNQWLDSAAVIAEGRVILTPPDSSELHCLDLRTGKLNWKRRQGDSLFLACVDQGNVLLVGAQSVQALRLSDGNSAWEKETLSLPSGALPAGHGYLSDGRYYLPLTSGQIAEIDIADAGLNTFAPAGANIGLGNLIHYRGSVLSQSVLALDRFDQLSALRKRTEAALAKNPDDATALRELAEIVRADGKKAEAVRTLKRAYDLAPDDFVTQEMLVEALLEELAADYKTYRADVPLIARLIHNREQQTELLRLDAAGLDAAGERLPAWDAYLKLADYTAEDPAYLRIEDKYTVRSDRWISGRLATMWKESSADERRSIEQRLAVRRPNLDNPRTAAELRHYLAHLEQLPGADKVRLALAAFSIDHNRLQEAEIEILQSLAAAERGAQSAAADLMAKLDAKTGTRTGRSNYQWPRGQVDAEVSSVAAAAGIRDRGVHLPADQKPGFRQLRIEQNFWPQAAPLHWFISIDCSEIIGRNALGDDVYHLAVDPNNLARQYRDSNLVHGAQLGHLLYVALGGQVMAIDSRQDRSSAAGELLWPAPAQDGIVRDPARPRRGPSNVQVRTTRPPLYHTFGRKRVAGSAGIALGSLGPVTPRGVVFQDENELKCVDPITGVTLWSRTDIPPGCELFGDNEFVLAADLGSKTAYVVRLVDGELTDERERPPAEWLMTAGRNVAQLSAGLVRGNRYSLSVTDIWAQKTLYQVELPSTSRISLVEPDAIAAFEPNGRFRVIDVESARVIVDEKLEAIPDAMALHTMRAGDDLFVLITSSVQQQFQPIARSFDYPTINGPVYAFSLKTGKPLWASPAVVRNRGIFLAQPVDVPFLVFADRKVNKEAGATANAQIRLLCLDKRTGETVYRNDDVPDTLISRFRIRAEIEPRPVVSLEMGAAKIQLAMTDRPRPPQAPANDALETSRELVERGLEGLGARILRGAIEKSSNTPRESSQQDSNDKPAPDPADEIDDD